VDIKHCHGYLGHEFLSSFDRPGKYGGSFENRIRLLLETIEAVRSVWPRDLPVFLRISSTDWVEGGWTLEDSIELCQVLKARGDIDLIDCSSGGNVAKATIPVAPGYQVPFAERIRRDAGIAGRRVQKEGDPRGRGPAHRGWCRARCRSASQQATASASACRS
jgi:2,4-dienoyl-CoA reductase-like NADH-dependent reductase (Old Yellow Enzyme family)